MAFATVGAPIPPALADVPAPAAPVQAAPSLEVQIDRVTPAVVAPGQTWAVQGNISNTGTTTLEVDRVRLSTAYRALDTVAELDKWIDDGEVVRTPRLAGVDELGAALGPGESIQFLIRVSGDTVRPSFPFASLPLRLDVEAADDTPLAQIRTVLPWYAAARAEDPLEVSWVIPLTVPPDPALRAVEPDRTEAWLDVVGPESPARTWLDGLTAYDATFVIDAALLLPLSPATDISQAPVTDVVPTPDTDEPAPTDPELPAPTQTPAPTGADPTSSTQTGKAPNEDEEGVTGSRPEDSGQDTAPDLPTQTPLNSLDLQEATPVQEAELALQERIGVLSRDQLRWLPVADPDVAALIDLDTERDVTDRVMAESLPSTVLEADRLLRRGTHGIAWPAWTAVDQDQIGDLQTLWGADPLSTVVLPRSTYGDSTGLNRDAVGTASQDEQVALYGYDEQISALLSPSDRAAGDGGTTQLVLAHLLARYQQFPADSGAVIIAPERGSSIDPSALSALTGALDQAPWVEQVAAADLPVQTGVRLGQPSALPDPAPSPLTATWITRIEEVRATLDEIATVLGRQDTVQAWDPVLDGLYSTRWRGSVEPWSPVLDELESQVGMIVDGVSIQETSVNFLANEGLIQLTVVNDLPIGLRDLELELDPGNGRLHILEQPPPISIGASSRATVQFRAEAVAAGQVPVRATLSTPTGLQIGQAQELDVQVRPTGIWIYWVLGGVAGVILILGLARAIRRPATASDPEST